jgi:hypothetical protein
MFYFSTGVSQAATTLFAKAVLLVNVGMWPVGRVCVIVLFYNLNRDSAFNEVVKDYGHCDAMHLAGLIRKNSKSS